MRAGGGGSPPQAASNRPTANEQRAENDTGDHQASSDGIVDAERLLRFPADFKARSRGLSTGRDRREVLVPRSDSSALQNSQVTVTEPSTLPRSCELVACGSDRSMRSIRSREQRHSARTAVRPEDAHAVLVEEPEQQLLRRQSRSVSSSDVADAHQDQRAAPAVLHRLAGAQELRALFRRRALRSSGSRRASVRPRRGRPPP